MFAVEVLKKELKRLRSLGEEYTSKGHIENLKWAIRLIEMHTILKGDKDENEDFVR